MLITQLDTQISVFPTAGVNLKTNFIFSCKGCTDDNTRTFNYKITATYKNGTNDNYGNNNC